MNQKHLKCTILDVVSMIPNNTVNISQNPYLKTIFLMMNYQQLGIGEILMVLTICLGVLTNIYLNIVDLVGLKPLLLLWLIELT